MIAYQVYYTLPWAIITTQAMQKPKLPLKGKTFM